LIQEAIFRLATRIMLPDLVEQMKAEGAFHLKIADPEATLEESEYLIIEDNQADVTIVTFTGPDILYMGHSRHHLRGVLKRAARRFGGANLVFLRDPQRLGFMLRPDGSPGGMEYYAGLVRDTLERLGASHNVAVGASWGGSIAHYIACLCGMHQVITFSPMYKPDPYLGMRGLLRSCLSLKLLVREPRAYSEVIVVTLSAWWCYKRVCERAGGDLPDISRTYRDMNPRPGMSLYYGVSAHGDAWQSKLMEEFAEVKHVPLPTGRHNTPGYLYAQRQLDKIIATEILAVYTPKAVHDEGTVPQQAG